MQYGYYSAEAIKKRQYDREKAIAKKVIIKTVKAFFWGAVVATIGFIAAYQVLIIAIDDQIDQSNIRDCQDVRDLSEPGRWAKLQNKCSQFYDTGNIQYMRQYHESLDNE
jgi:hypothetical protein